MCRCSQTWIPYAQFMSLNSQFHQVCLSDFVNEGWFSSLFNIDTSNYYPLDFRLMASAQFQVLSIFFRISRQTVIDALKGYSTTIMLSPNVLSRDVLNSYISTVSEEWFSSLFNVNTSNYYPLDFRLMASAQFQILSILCRTSRRVVNGALIEFAAMTILSPSALSRDVVST
ncbi:unnamed protein product [Rotaria sordida]|uniref:Uncharacterized protein n=1 Tax=Rotaria sordida TaxID=392033 RepID=A0A815EB91_9BILA|nr:unnamed protein product [Rotaria sordida]